MVEVFFSSPRLGQGAHGGTMVSAHLGHVSRSSSYGTEEEEGC